VQAVPCWAVGLSRGSAVEPGREIADGELVLGHEGHGAGIGDRGAGAQRRIGGGEDDPHAAVAIDEPAREREAGGVGQLHVDERRIRMQSSGRGQRLLAVGGLAHHRVSPGLEERAREGAEALVVVDDEDSCRHRVQTAWGLASSAAIGISRGGSVARMAVRVVVGEDQPLVREGIVHVLERAGFEVVAVAGDAPDLIRKTNAHKPDVVVTDIQMPPDGTDDGLRAAIEIRRSRPETGVLVLSQFLEDRYPLELVGDRAEGVGYLLKERVGDLSLFAESVRRVAAGGSALDPQVVQRMVGRRRESSPLDELTPRERDVMALMAEGRSNGGIAAELIVTVPAVERHVTSIFDKLGLRQAPEDHRRVLAVLEYLKRG
jgi:DNA-binding NarL/FixJ family response regulator